MSAPEPLQQLDQQILDGELLMGHLRHLVDEAGNLPLIATSQEVEQSKAEKRAMREEVREIEAKVAYMKRRRSALLTKWWSDIAGKPMPAYDETAATNAMAERFRQIAEARGEGE